MNPDEAMDRLLKEAMAADVPVLSPSFDARVARGVRPWRLTTAGRVLLVLYAVVAATAAAWLMRDLPATWIATALAAVVPLAAGTGAYTRRLVVRS